MNSYTAYLHMYHEKKKLSLFYVFLKYIFKIYFNTFNSAGWVVTSENVIADTKKYKIKILYFNF